MATKRKIRDEQDARRCLAAAQASRKSRSAWARQHGVDGRSLYAWDKKLAPDAEASKKPERHGGLVELIPNSADVASRYVVRCGRLAVEIDDHFDEATLGRLLKVIAAC